MRVIVAEDSGLIRDALTLSLPDYGVEVCATARTTEELLRLVEADPPELVLIDIAMPLRDREASPEYNNFGLEAAQRIRKSHPDVALLALSQYSEAPWAEEIAGMGMKVGYLVKDRVRRMTELVETMRDVVAGEIRIDPHLVAALVRRKRLNDPVAMLSKRESEILNLMAEGFSDPAIATRVHLSSSTVEGYARTIYQKLGLSELRKAPDGTSLMNLRVLAVLAFLRSGRPPS
jgi:DNA-binding NarL/FixJ family response regulator